ncbi:hypothetical protein Cgig2_022444 [Carnegiea gigantea]|uniref:Uncharacterized protein n=1 Tax=Carnegiea gigantea TaxID=171969 RepID=A0A9Q1KAI2_9CARY|nr:hypothetical protein Cgig2_022444 [Carnegiea gigantea]
MATNPCFAASSTVVGLGTSCLSHSSPKSTPLTPGFLRPQVAPRNPLRLARPPSLHLSEGLAKKGLQCDRVRVDWVDSPIKHTSNQWKQPHRALLLQHWSGALPLPHWPCPHFPVLYYESNHVPSVLDTLGIGMGDVYKLQSSYVIFSKVTLKNNY